MLQSPDNSKNTSSTTSYTPAKTVSTPSEQATIGKTLVIKGEISGDESLFIDGKVEGSITVKNHRVTVGRNGYVGANIQANEVVIMGKVTGNVECTDRLDIRAEGQLTGDVITHRISVEDGALLKGSVQVRSNDKKEDKNEKNKASNDQTKAASAHA